MAANTGKLFKRALGAILYSNEIQKLVAAAQDEEKEELERYVCSVQDICGVDESEIQKIPVIALIHDLKSPMLWQDVMVYMLGMEGDDGD